MLASYCKYFSKTFIASSLSAQLNFRNERSLFKLYDCAYSIVAFRILKEVFIRASSAFPSFTSEVPTISVRPKSSITRLGILTLPVTASIFLQASSYSELNKTLYKSSRALFNPFEFPFKIFARRSSPK